MSRARFLSLVTPPAALISASRAFFSSSPSRVEVGPPEADEREVFVTELVTRDEPRIGPGRPCKRLVSDLAFRDRVGRVFVVPAGFPSTGSAIPRWLWCVVPPFGEPSEPALWLRERLYRHPERNLVVTRDGELRAMRRREVDAVVRQAVRACRGGGVGLGVALRLTGWWTWRQARASRWR